MTRLIKQQSSTESDAKDEGESYAKDLSVARMVNEIWQEGGVGAFFRGSGERVLYWAPAIGIFLTAYCQFRHLMLG